MNLSSPQRLLFGLGLVMVAQLASLTEARAQEVNKIIVVPFSQQNPALPHPAHEGAPITLKAIIRNANCATYTITWDVNQDPAQPNIFANDTSFTASRNGTTNTVYDIGRLYTVPYVDSDTQLNVSVRARSNCDNTETFGTFKLFVYNFGENGTGAQQLSRDPRNWTTDQLDIIVSMAIQESMWYTHRWMQDYSGTGATMEARSNYTEATGISQWLFVINNHLPAYPPAVVGAGDASAEWRAVNQARWDNDPYAESAMRLLNYNVARTGNAGVPADDEANDCGYGNGNRVIPCAPIPGTDDRVGLYARSSNVYLTGMNTGAISTVLPALSGTNVRAGIAAGQSWEWYVQQLVDYLGYQQADSGCANGGWYYGAVDSGDCRYSDLSTTQWAYIGMESAEVAGGPYGVFVNNRQKYRIANNIVTNQQGDGGGAYDNRRWGTSDLKLTGGQLLAARWLDLQNMSTTSNSTPFPNESGHSYRTLRQYHDNYFNFIRTWYAQRRVSGTLGWQDGLWQNGDYLCGNTSTVYNAPRCGNSYSLYSHQKGYHTGLPMLEFVGPHDWYRHFSIYYARAQYRPSSSGDGRSNYNDMGALWDDYCEVHSVTCAYGPRHMSTAMGGLVLTPAVFNPKPIPLGSLAPIVGDQPPVTSVTVTEGCLTGEGRISVDHEKSFHPNSYNRIVAYYWDMDASNGLWWETGAAPDLDANGNPMRTGDQFANLDYVYRRQGTYTVTLRVEDNTNQYKSVVVGTVRVQGAQDVPPAIATGGPYVIEVGQNLQLNGAASDGNQACGDVLTVGWNLDYALNQNTSFEVSGEKALVTWNNAAGLGVLPRNVPFTIKARVTDTLGGPTSVEEETTLAIYDATPIADARANPTQLACRQNVTFDASASRHPNPQRTISNYQWSVGGVTSDRATFTTSFASFGARTARLTVVDDLGRSATATVDVNVNLGNLPPVVRVPSTSVTVMSTAALSLSATQSSDPNADCGDSIQQIGWYLLSPGEAFNAANAPDFTGASVQIPSADWQAAMRWPGNESFVVRVVVRDTFGAFSTADITVTGVRAEPVPVIRQIPDPSTYRLDNGASSTRLDGRESTSLLAGVTIARYQWDINCDGSYEREDGQFLYETNFPPNTPLAQLPPVRVCLRVTDSNGTAVVSPPYTVRYQQLGSASPYADADPSDAPERGYNILVGQGLTLDASSSFDPDTQDFNDYITRYQWTLNGTTNASLVKDSTGANDAPSKTLTLTPAALAALGVSAVGSYPVRLDVRDLAGNTGSDTSSVTVHNATANLVVVMNPTNAAPNSRVTFDASRSEHTHPDIDIVGVVWFFGNLVTAGGACVTDADCNASYCITNPSTSALQCMTGSLGTQVGAVVNQSFTQMTPPGSAPIPVTVVVRDSNGGQAQSAGLGLPVDQGNRLPVANPGGGTAPGGNVVVGAYTLINQAAQSVVFNGSASNDPDSVYGDAITSYTWAIGTCRCSTVAAQHANCPVPQAQVGATLPAISFAQLAQCNITQTGTHTVSLTVRDRFNATSTGTTSLNVVLGPDALAQAQPNRTSCQQQVTFDGRGSLANGPVDQGYNIVRYEWDFNDDGTVDFTDATFTTPVVALPSNNTTQLNARLTVTNAIGMYLIGRGQDPGPNRNSEVVSVVINVQQLPPVANPGGPYRTGGSPGNFAPVTVDGRASSDPNAPCDEVVEYWWDTNNDGQFGLEDTDANAPTTTNGARSDYVGPTATFTNNAWLVNTTSTVRLKVRDRFGAWSAPASADIVITDVVPPSGEILSPRAGDCAASTGPGTSTARVLVTHPVPNPQAVDVTVRLGAQVVGTARVQANQFNAQKQTTVDIPLANIAEGQQNLVATFALVGNANASTQANSGGAVVFDFTPPLITIGAQPTAGVCYANGRVPAAEISVDDNFDDAPQVSQSVIESGCGRTLRVTARDFCGRESVAERSYLTAQAVSVTVNGVQQDALQGSANISWQVEGIAACANGVEATLSRDGGAFAAYAANTPITTPGDYSLRLTVYNCLGVAREQTLAFRINRDPVAVAIPDGHPNADPSAVNAYRVVEGSPLTLDGTLSRAPELDDSIARYTWTIPGQPALTGPRPVMNTNTNGVFNGTLEVEDGFGETHSQAFQVTVTDLSPVANAGGPYVANQDVAITFNATNSRSLNPAADPITRYVWSWGDGTPNSEGAVVSHTFTTQGAYNVRLTVYDEDSSVEVIVGVIIADVDPQIDDIFVEEVMGEENTERPDPVVAYEVLPIKFGVIAQPGGDFDPITLYQWDFDGDNIFDVNTTEPYAEHQYMEPGVYTLGVLVRDRDSFTFRTQLVDVRPVDFETTFRFVGYGLQSQLDAGVLSPINRLRLAQTHKSIEAGVWGQVYDGLVTDAPTELTGALTAGRARPLHLQTQGVSYLAAGRVLTDLVQAQTRGANFGTEVWALARQLRREVGYDLSAVSADAEGLYAGRRADARYTHRLSVSSALRDAAVATYSAPNFEPDARTVPNTDGLSLSVQDDAIRSLDWLNIAVDQCADPRFNTFAVNVPPTNPVAYFDAAEGVRVSALEALTAMLAEMEAYVERGGAVAGPGREEIAAAADSLRLINERAAKSMAARCFTEAGRQDPTCSNNENALAIELEAMTLIEALNAASSQGAYVMHWQSCLVDYLRFRVKASVVAVRDQCGQLNSLYIKANEIFNAGESLLTQDDDIIGALNFYTDNAQRCLILDVYNKCLVRVDPTLEAYPYPDVCLQ